MGNKVIGTILIHILTLNSLLESISTELYPDDGDQNERQATGEHYVNQHYKRLNEDRDSQKDILGYKQYSTGKHFVNVPSELEMVRENGVFPYMVTVLKDAKYLSNGALVDESWVLTAADRLLIFVDSIKFLRVRLGSINYKKGGVLMPVKLIEIHPYFDGKRPNFDLALIMLAKPVRFTPTMKAIRIQMTPREVTATHFIVTSWPGPLEVKSKQPANLKSLESIKYDRIMRVAHLHPMDPEECAEELEGIGAAKDAIMCLDPAVDNPCMRDVGAPVVLNHVLWAVVSSWRPDHCEEYSGPIFATLVSAGNISQWIHGTVHGHRWKQSS